mmetsp:Transcript_43135/g.60508  ORF Transcript_43135/g.60508 Transcript_43135/m.60508 type:complete len:94 (-) Transcript_43135:25-306(-)
MLKFGNKEVHSKTWMKNLMLLINNLLKGPKHWRRSRVTVVGLVVNVVLVGTKFSAQFLKLSPSLSPNKTVKKIFFSHQPKFGSHDSQIEEKKH